VQAADDVVLVVAAPVVLVLMPDAVNIAGSAMTIKGTM
jgi:hypothetical protein